MMHRLRSPRLRVSPAAAVLFVAMALTDHSHLCAAVLLAAAVHEMGHLLAARLLGIPLRVLRLELLGARLEVVGRMLSYGEEWLLCMAGPLTSLLLSLFILTVVPKTAFFTYLAAASCLLGLLNLLPICGFDGGRMLSAALGRMASDRVSEGILRGASFLCVFLIWATAVYCLLRVGDGLSLFCFSMGLFVRLLSASEDG